MGEISIREYRSSDLDPVLRLLKSSLGETSLLRRSAEWFGWKHLDNPFGPSILLVAESGDQVVGLRAFMRWELAHPHGRRVRCVRAVDTATHPDFLRRGIFRSLTESALEVARADGVDMVFNTPNPKSGAGYLKMGWRDVGLIGVMVHPRPIRLMGSRRHAAAGDLAGMVPSGQPAGSLDVTDREPNGLRTPRTPGYLKWRYSGNPNAVYVATEDGMDTAVLRANLRNGRREVVVSDVFGEDLRRTMSRARGRSHADYVVAWFSKGSPERRAALSAGLVPIPRVKPFRLVVNPLTDLGMDVTSLAAWDVSMGDMELL